MPPFRDEPLYPKTWLTTALADLGREIDNKWKADALSEADLKKFASEKGLWLVAVMNKQGRVVFQSRPLPADFFPGTCRFRKSSRPSPKCDSGD